jgi:hypothetical protein
LTSILEACDLTALAALFDAISAIIILSATTKEIYKKMEIINEE